MALRMLRSSRPTKTMAMWRRRGDTRILPRSSAWPVPPWSRMTATLTFSNPRSGSTSPVHVLPLRTRSQKVRRAGPRGLTGIRQSSAARQLLRQNKGSVATRERAVDRSEPLQEVLLLGLVGLVHPGEDEHHDRYEEQDHPGPPELPRRVELDD